MNIGLTQSSGTTKLKIEQMKLTRIYLALFCLIYFILQPFTALSQQVHVRGQVKGLISHDRKTKPVVLSKVNVSVTLDKTPVTVNTNLAGVYMLELERDKHYLMTVSREGYNAKSIYINTKNLPILKSKKNIEITDLDFLLLKTEFFPNDISLKEDMGQLVFNAKNNRFQISVNKDFKRQIDAKDFSIKLVKKNITYVEREIEEADTLERKIRKETQVSMDSAIPSFSRAC